MWDDGDTEAGWVGARGQPPTVPGNGMALDNQGKNRAMYP